MERKRERKLMMVDVRVTILGQLDFTENYSRFFSSFFKNKRLTNSLILCFSVCMLRAELDGHL